MVMDSVSVLLLLVLMLFNSCLLEAQSNLRKHIYPAEVDNNTTHIYIGLIVSFGGEFNTSADVPGVHAAIDGINQDTSILQNYTLHYVLSDSQCDRTIALSVLFEQVSTPPVKIAIIGAGCSPATEPTAEISHFYNVTQISCSSVSRELTNRKRYPRYFQLLQSIDVLAHAYDGIVETFSWRHVVFILQNENIFTNVVEESKQLFDERNISYSVYSFQTNDGIGSMDIKLFKNPDERIFIIATYESFAADILCEAYKRNLKYPSHIFITFQWYISQWWLKYDFNTTCEGWQPATVLDRSLAVNFLRSRETLEESTDISVGGNQFIEDIEELTEVYGYRVTTPYCFDATWTLAYALNDTIGDILSNDTLNGLLSDAYGNLSSNFQLNHFNYNNDALLNILFSHLSDPNRSLQGLTGQISFDESGIRKAYILDVFQFRTNVEKGELDCILVGEFMLNTSTYSFVFAANETVTTIWPDGVPYDGIVQRIITTILLPVTIVMSLLATSGIFFSISCTLFNFILRNRKLIRLTSPKLNYIIIFGAFLLYIDVYFFVVPTSNPDVSSALRKVTTWLTGIGYTLCFGTILAKLTRVWFIFNNPKPTVRKAIKDWMLIVGVSLLVGIDIIILTIYTAIEETSDQTLVKLIPSRELPPETISNITMEYQVYISDSKFEDIIIGLYNGYKVVLQVVALVFAFLTRKVKVKGLDDSKFIAAIVYITSITLAVLIVSEYALREFINVHSVVFSAGVLVAATSVLGLVFIPKMVGVYKDPQGETIFSKQSSENTTDRFVTLAKPLTDEVETLKNRVRELEVLLSNEKTSKVDETYNGKTN